MSFGNHAIRCTRLTVASSHRRTTAIALRNPQFPRRNWAVFGSRRFAHSPADGADFTSIVDNSPDLVKSGKRHGPGIIILALIPITAFALGTWQVFRLGWKTELIARFEDRLIKPPLPLPPRIDPEAIKDFDYRKVYTTGHLCHEQEMLIGPRIHDGNDGFLVVTPLKRGDGGSTVLVNRGWIPRNKKAQAERGDGLPRGLVTIEGLLREPWQKNMFTPNNRPDLGQFYFPDVKQMAELTGSEAVWIEETMSPDLLKAYDREAKGVPIGRPAAVNLRNNHTQYIFTWYALSAATTIMLWMVVRKPPSEVARRIRQNKNW
ncbi:MAG: hypothetical protein LQ349_001333 [Xanthoria aureola]|nr:MAG: hypothetical protein LQ349_001333 [Xanthoria aureola]